MVSSFHTILHHGYHSWSHRSTTNFNLTVIRATAICCLLFLLQLKSQHEAYAKSVRKVIHAVSRSHTMHAIFVCTKLLLFCLPTTTLFVLQLRGPAMPASDLQSQLNDMLDDSASDTSSIPQNILALSPPLRAAPAPFASPGPQAGVPGPKLAMPGGNNDFEGMQMRAQGLDPMQQQQMSELQGQLQVSCTLHSCNQISDSMWRLSCCFKHTA